MQDERERRPSARDRVCFALDYPSLSEAQQGAERVAQEVGVFKVGLELFVRFGPEAVTAVKRLGRPLFLDLKLHDIPTTVERAVASAANLGVDYLTLHAFGGPEMIGAARRRLDQENSAVKLLGVTVLTSMNTAQLRAVGVTAPPLEQVRTLGRMACDAGADGLVCAVGEIEGLRELLGDGLTLVTPGIRPRGADRGDQSRAQTPHEAIRAGADLLIVGRPIRDAASPAESARAIVKEVAGALAH